MEPVERLGRCVVVTVTLGPDRHDDVVDGEPFGLAHVQKWDAAVAVMDQVRQVGAGALAVEDRYLRCIDREVCVQRAGYLLADDHQREHVDDEHDLGPAGVHLM